MITYRPFRLLSSHVIPLVLFLFAAAMTGWHPLPARAATSFDLSTAIVQVAKQTIPAVVHVEVTERQEVANPFLPFEKDPSFRQFFGDRKLPRKFKREVRGLGTGMIMDAEGHILTNYHVAGGASKIEVQLSNGRRYTASLVGGDPKTDLAVIRISAGERLPHVTFGDSDKMEVGEWVVTIGAPRGLDQTVTQGIISAKHRTGITDPSSYEDFLQTDAAINPGNSGGPLLNLRGEVIGVNAAIASESGGFEGIGFAIPSNIALYIGKTLVAKGKVERGWLGVSVEDVSYERAKTLGMPVPKGAYVAQIMKGSPAEKAGLQQGDVITAFQGKEVPDASILRNEVSVTSIGSSARITILRAGKREELTVTIGNLQDAAKILTATAEERLGANFRGLTPEEVQKYGLEANQGVVINKVDPKGPLGRSGFEVGDMILEINGQVIAGVDGLGDLLGLLRPKQQITVLAVDHRSGNAGTVQVVVQ